MTRRENPNPTDDFYSQVWCTSTPTPVFLSQQEPNCTALCNQLYKECLEGSLKCRLVPTTGTLTPSTSCPPPGGWAAHGPPALTKGPAT